MSNAVAIITHSGFGKSTSLGRIKADEKNGLPQDIMGLDPTQTILINIKGKPLPWRGWSKEYYPPISAGGNYVATTDPQAILGIMDYVDKERQEIRNLVIDDFQFIMSEEFMTHALKTGFEKFSKMAKNAYDVINTGLKLRSNINFFVLTHSEETKTGFKFKTIGETFCLN